MHVHETSVNAGKEHLDMAKSDPPTAVRNLMRDLDEEQHEEEIEQLHALKSKNTKTPTPKKTKNTT